MKCTKINKLGNLDVRTFLTAAVGQTQDGLSVAGTVVNFHTGEPLKRALVVVRNQGLFTASTFTDSGGSFAFHGLVAGEHVVRAQKPMTSSVSDLKIELALLGVITGKIVDQYGEPMRHVDVVA